DKSPFVTSGIRIGTPAVTTRGLVESDMAKVVDLMDRAITNAENEEELEAVKKEVISMIKERPLFKA
ncbi:serine hydroxymethyltransferase, partial [Flavobacterium sp. IR1]